MKCKYLSVMALAFVLGLQTPVATAAVPHNPIDLTYAAENAVNSVVYIKVTTNGRTETVQYRDPFGFEDFFGDFFGRGNGGNQQRKSRLPSAQVLVLE